MNILNIFYFYFLLLFCDCVEIENKDLNHIPPTILQTSNTTVFTTLTTTPTTISIDTFEELTDSDELYNYTRIELDVEDHLNTTNWEQDLRCVYAEYYHCFNYCNNIEVKKYDVYGLWSNCLNSSCTLYYKINENEFPIGLEITACTNDFHKYTSLEVTVEINGQNHSRELESLPGCDTTYVDFADFFYNITEFEVQKLFVNQSSVYPGFIAIDKIVLILKEGGTSIPTTPTLPTTITTTTTTTTNTTTITTTTTPPTHCSDEVKCTGRDNRGLYWEICPGKAQIQKCPGSSVGTASWYCNNSSHFEPNTPNYKNCSSDWIKKMEENIENEEEIDGNRARDFLEEINKITNIEDNQISYFGHELRKILNLSESVLKKVKQDTILEDFENLASTAVHVSHNILINKEPWEELNQDEKVDTGTYFINSLEGKVFGLTSRNQTEVGYSKDFNAFNEFLTKIEIVKSKENKIIFPGEDEESFIELPKHLEINSSSIKYVGIRLNSEYANSIFLPNSKQIINGELLSITIQPNTLNEGKEYTKSNFNLSQEGVRIRIKHNISAWGDTIKNIRRKLHVNSGERPKGVLGTKDSCVFWDTIKLKWSNEGCKLIEHDVEYTLCECNHLTAFAVLMDVHNYVGKDKGLELLTWILLTISSICLIICIGVYSLSNIQAIRSPRGIITNNLCICLLIGNILFLIFVDRNLLHLNQGFCTTFGILAHYFFLSGFFWMGFEGYVLYKVVIIVFDDGKDRFTMQYTIAYGGPGIIVLITGLTAIGLGDDAYESDMFCWLSGNYIWAFMGPIGIIIIGNTIMLGISIKKASDLSKNPTLGTTRHTKAFFTWVKGTVSLTVLLGITWGFGFFMIIENNTFSNIAAYLFTILNSSQGIFLFIFHIIMNEKIRNSLNRRFNIYWSNNRSKQSQKTTTQTISNQQQTTNNAKLTFRTALSRKRRRIQKYFSKEENQKNFNDNIMPNSETSSKTTNTLKLSQSSQSALPQ